MKKILKQIHRSLRICDRLRDNQVLKTNYSVSQTEDAVEYCPPGLLINITYYTTEQCLNIITSYFVLFQVP
jgi:hypothetical protein